MGGRPLLWLTSHQREKIAAGLISDYQPSPALASLNAGADGAVGAQGAAAGGAPRRLIFPAGLPPVGIVWEGTPITGAPAKWVQQQARIGAGRRAALRRRQGAVQRERAASASPARRRGAFLSPGRTTHPPYDTWHTK